MISATTYQKVNSSIVSKGPMNSFNEMFPLAVMYKRYSPEHAILQVVEQINRSFEKNEFTPGVFVDSSKVFDTVDHQIFLRKLEYYGIAGNYLRWFENYLTGRKQFISFEHNSTKKATVPCGVPQGSILGPLLFLLYVNDLQSCSRATKTSSSHTVTLISCLKK